MPVLKTIGFAAGSGGLDVNAYERFLYWEGFRYGREWANAVSFPSEVMKRAEANLWRNGITPLTPAGKDELVEAMKEAMK